ncbi:response regulator transcription factor [Brevibacillus agri]|uniref:response regulator transcription factor n=1 Tax=Brevibacillus agri TaxID=51101 RepID=UPI0002A4F3AF|nr:response regulator transcription factor [Brevibacillus agri]ELK41296.1 transcriptional regulatory protein resD [Brevibacillus agri BAB-2500]MDR9506787.1 response regulator transcription factor [Brevibacillus agri]
MGESPSTILIVDDEERIRRILRMYLEKAGYVADEADDGSAALSLAEQIDYDLIILDLMLPEMDGIELCRRLRKRQQVPIVIVSARGEQADRLRGFEAGADDYVVKPFSPHELMYRIRAILQRARSQQEKAGESRAAPAAIAYSDLLIEPLAHRVTVGGNVVELARKEFDLLHFLALHPNETFSREDLLRHVWNDASVQRDARTVDTHVRKIRKKLFQRSPAAAGLIATVWGWGYQLCATDQNVQNG